ncbi:MAG: DUF5678 domain-containing protein [Anaerolineae bacterium]|jgi:hypothetical protein
MAILQVSEELIGEIQHEAATRGLDVEEFLRAAIQRERTLADRRKIEREQAWWLALSLGERARYEGKLVAIHNQRVVDHDESERALYQRVRARYGQTPVLIIPAEGPREIRVYSPRLVSQ